MLTRSLCGFSVLFAVLRAEQIEGIVFALGIVLAVVAAAVLTLYEKRQRKLRGDAGPDPDLCAYIKKNGEQCQHEPKRGSRYCALHSRRVLMDRIRNAPRQSVYEIEESCGEPSQMKYRIATTLAKRKTGRGTI